MKAVIGLVILAVVLLIWLFKVARKVGNGVYDEAFRPPEPRFRPSSLSRLSPKSATVLGVCSELLATQLAMACADPRRLVNDRWALGYLLGFHDGFMQRAGVGTDDIEGFALLSGSYIALFDDPDLTGTLVATSLKLQGETQFDAGMATGGREAFQFIDKQVPPVGLSDHLFGAKTESAAGCPARGTGYRRPATQAHTQAVQTVVATSTTPGGRRSEKTSNRVSAKWLLVPLGTLAALVLFIRLSAQELDPDSAEAPPSLAAATTARSAETKEATSVAATDSSQAVESTPQVVPPAGERPEQPAKRPSFDCASVLSPVEVIICGNAILGGLDAEMAHLYERPMPLVASPELLRQDQRDWLRSIRAICDGEACLENAYRARNEVLRKGLE